MRLIRKGKLSKLEKGDKIHFMPLRKKVYIVSKNNEVIDFILEEKTDDHYPGSVGTHMNFIRLARLMCCSAGLSFEIRGNECVIK